MASLKYILIFCIALTLVLKASHRSTYIFSQSVTQTLLAQEESEKDENKIESYYFVNQDISTQLLLYSSEPVKTFSFREVFFYIAFFPEVLTPPPSSQA